MAKATWYGSATGRSLSHNNLTASGPSIFVFTGPGAMALIEIPSSGSFDRRARINPFNYTVENLIVSTVSWPFYSDALTALLLAA